MMIVVRSTLLLILVLSDLLGMVAQTKDDKIIVVGEIIGFQPQKRCPDCSPVKGISHRAENLIFRIYGPVDLANEGKIILIDYAIYYRGISDKEVDSGKLEFALRKKPEDWANDCRGTIDFEINKEKVWRPGELMDYKLIKGYKATDLPDFDALPCYYGGTPPVDLEALKRP